MRPRMPTRTRMCMHTRTRLLPTDALRAIALAYWHAHALAEVFPFNYVLFGHCIELRSNSKNVWTSCSRHVHINILRVLAVRVDLLVDQPYYLHNYQNDSTFEIRPFLY
jgi:hypothetical protein